MREISSREYANKVEDKSMNKEIEHMTEEIDRCPVCHRTKCESGIDGYVDYDFTDTGVYFTYHCYACGTDYHEMYQYSATYHYTYEEK